MSDRGQDDNFLLDPTRILVQAHLHPPPLHATGRDAFGVAGSVGRACVRGQGLGYGDTET
jgi:hypothetical protein